ncbi:MAG TPA: DinB family protein [Bacteroidota bacterium]|nr:DinB family protein [Bacteroidota bacterium]
MNGEMHQVLAMIDEAYGGKAWHGPTLRGSLRGLSAAEASWRPGRGRHSIREIVLHAAYWKYTVRRRLTGAGRGSFRLKGHNWFPRRGRPGETSWEEEVAILESEHALMRRAIERGGVRAMRARVGRTLKGEALIRGIAAHDLYHAGQVQLIKRLRRR